MTKIILTLLAIAVCAEATFDIGLLLNLLQPPAPKIHHPPPPQVNYRKVQQLVPVQPVRYYYLRRVTPHDASYYRQPASPPVDVPQFPAISQPPATDFSDSITVEAQPQPLSFTQVGSRQATPEQFTVETVKSESHSFALQPEPLHPNLDQTR